MKNRIKVIRAELDLTQEELSKKIGISRTLIIQQNALQTKNFFDFDVVLKQQKEETSIRPRLSSSPNRSCPLDPSGKNKEVHMITNQPYSMTITSGASENMRGEFDTAAEEPNDGAVSPADIAEGVPELPPVGAGCKEDETGRGSDGVFADPHAVPERAEVQCGEVQTARD